MQQPWEEIFQSFRTGTYCGQNTWRKLHILDGTNWLYSKYLLNEEDKESKYLVYAAFAKPSDAENPLADMYYYSTPYYTDRVSQMSQEIGIDNRFKEHLSQYGNFWKNKHRIEKFKELGIDHYNAQTIDIGLIAVLTDVKTPNFEEVVKQMMLGDNEKYFKALDDNGLTEKFWELCEKFFGYKSEKPNMDDLSACMILTYASSTLRATVPEAMRTYILKKRNDVVVFIRNIMDNVNYQDAYDKLVERIDKSLRFVTRIQDGLKKDVEKKKDSSLQMSDIFACDAFAGLDDIIIDWALEQLNDEILDAQIDGLNIAQIADQRMSKAYHYSESLLPHNEMQVDGNLNVTVDGQACASMEQRDKILKSYNENNVALSFDEVANANQARIRELIQGKNIVYIYHNQVDARGDKPASENEVFNACAEAIEEIHKLVKKLTGYVSAPKFFITADHGFLYKRDRLQEFDKVTYPKDKCLYTNKRFLITEDAVNEQGIMARTMAYLNKLYVDTPVGADIFKVAGGGQNYVHGGTSLQEMMVPVIELTTNTRGVAYDYVDVVLTSVDEHFVSVPEQGGGKMIPEGMGKPGCLYTVSKSKTGMIGCYRLETQMMPGNGKLTCTGIGSGKEPKEATNTAFNYLKANGNAISGSISTTTKDYIINYQDMQGLGMTGNLALPTLIAISSAALSKPPISSLAVLGEISIGGTLIKVEDLASTLQVCLDSGAKKVLLPITSAADLGTVPSDLVGAFSLIFYSSPEEAVYKALGVE